MVSIINFITGFLSISLYYILQKFVQIPNFLEFTNCTLHPVLMCIFMGLRQNHFDAKIVTPIPWFSGNLKIPLKVFFRIL